MSFSYDPTTNVGKLRREIGDTEEASYILSDEEISVILTERGTLAAQALDAVSQIINRLSLNSYDVQAGQQKETASQRISFYREVQKRVRSKYLIGKLTG